MMSPTTRAIWTGKGRPRAGPDAGGAHARNIKAYDLWPVNFSHEDWRQWKAKAARERAKRNYAKRKAERSATSKTRAVALLRRLLADGPKPVDRIFRLAAAEGLRQRGATRASCALRAAAKFLGVERRKSSMKAGWWWSLPQARNTAQPVDIREGAHHRAKGGENPHFAEGAKSSSRTAKLAISANGRETKPQAPACRAPSAPRENHHGVLNGGAIPQATRSPFGSLCPDAVVQRLPPEVDELRHRMAERERELFACGGPRMRTMAANVVAFARTLHAQQAVPPDATRH